MLSSAAFLKVQLRSRVPDAQLKARLPGNVEQGEFALVVRQQAAVYRPDGVPLVVLLKNAYTPELAEAAYPALHELRKQKSDNRATYAAAVVSTTGGGGKQNRSRNQDGSVVQVASAVVGYFDQQGGRHPHCRTTAFTANEVVKWQTIVPIVQRTAELFKQLLPNQYAAQLKATAQCDQHWIIQGTPFSTLTVNNNTRAGIHKDAGDYKDGFGCMSVFRRGSYRGCWLGFPQYGVAVDMDDRDLVFFNPHEYHANTAYEDQSADAERISVVYYFREKIKNCGTPEQEVAKARRTGFGAL